MDKLTSMRTFVRIVETGSLTAAANDLGVSLPTVVRTLAWLEQRLGTSLLKRTTRRIHITDEGVQYLERCRTILSAVREAEDALGARRRTLQGKLTVTASVQFGKRYVAPFLAGFLARHPSLTAELLLLNRVVNLIDEGVDVAVRIADLKESSLASVPLGHVRRVLCASPQYLERHGLPQVPADVKRHRCIRHTVLTPRDEWHFRVGKRNVLVPIAPVLVSNDIESALEACMSGLGLGMFFSYMVSEDIANGRLVALLDQFEVDPTPVQIVYPASRLVSNNVREFVNECAAELGGVKFG